jgi:predicted nucleic acid-binding protein
VSLVLDGSAVLAWCFEDETTPAIDALMLNVAANGAWVPNLWRLEVANGMQSGIRRRSLTAEKRQALLAALTDMHITTDGETDRHAWYTTTALADELRLTLYDASYLELAIRRRLALATLDSALAEAAKRKSVPLAL